MRIATRTIRTATAPAEGTGLAFAGSSTTYEICPAFAGLAAGLAVLRTVPRSHRGHCLAGGPYRSHPALDLRLWTDPAYGEALLAG